MKLLHVRHATSILTYAGYRILIDPVFSQKESFTHIAMTPNRRRNPMVDLSTELEVLLDVDIILSTHTHNDHFDPKAKELLDKELPLVCQWKDAEQFQSLGFRNLNPVKDSIHYEGISITRVDAQHGTGVTLKAMGLASGYILKSDIEPTVYITGDTIYNESVKENIINYKPQILIMNAGSPKFLNSNPIVMNIMDIEKTLKVNPNLTFVIVHLDTFNHCIETREDIHEYFTSDKLNELGINRFYVPEDNELLEESCFMK